VRYFFSSGEPSGESVAVLLAGAISNVDPDARFEGIGARGMRAAGFQLWRDHTGWASMGPLAAIPRIPKLLATMWLTAFHLRRNPPDLVVLVDFGVFNLRLASTLRRLGYAGPVLDVFPPGTWLDDERKARLVASVAVALTAFEHQSTFYRRLGCPIAYFGHPLTGRYALRPFRQPAPSDGGTIAILPGSRSGELRYHVPLLIAAYRSLRERRPRLRAVFAAADERGAATIHRAIAEAGLNDAAVERGAAAALNDADAAWASSGTAVLEAALCGVPTVALYVIAPMLAKHGRKMIKHRFITLPNLVLGREVVPELLQENATPQRLADEMESVLRHPARQYGEFVALRQALGPSDALERCARFAVALAKREVAGP
jgi:lipid-A-disaccharide synthase